MTGADGAVSSQVNQRHSVMTDMPDIPEFLLVKNRVAGVPDPDWIKNAKRAERKRQRDFTMPKSIEPAGLQLQKQIERERDAAQKARFAALRERSNR